MFSKALFKQSMKANWIKWVSVTVATCVMLAIVIIVLGNLGINNIRDSLKDIFVQADQESELKEQAVDGYELYITSVDTYDVLHNSANTSTIEKIITNYEEEYNTLSSQGGVSQEQKNQLMLQVAEKYAKIYAIVADEQYLTSFFYNAIYNYDNYDGTVSSYDAIIDLAYIDTVYDMAYQQYLVQTPDQENFVIMKAQMAKDIAFTALSKRIELGVDADFESLALEYMNLTIYNSTYETQKSSGYTEDECLMYAVSAKVISNTAISTYVLWLDEFEKSNIESGLGSTITPEQKLDARNYACQSISDQIPEKVAEALTELGNMDMYSLIIGSIFYRIAGLLLPMVFVIMTANGLLAGQVDSGSMAYVLSTPTKRRTVAFTQMTYLIAALFSMFALLTAVSVTAVFVSGGNDFAINYGQILLFNLGAFLTMFAIAGFCYMCSSLFNRTKYSLGLGGGITIFSLVCTILGLFGSSVVPSAMRIEPMNFFNYLSIITLFDTNEIMLGGLDYIWKFGILLGVGLITFIIGVFRFEKKDLPL